MSDVLFIDGLVLRTRIGITERERSQPQDVVLDITLHVDLDPAAASDAIDDALDYGAVIKDIQTVLEPQERKTVERLALDVSRLCLRRRRCDRVDVRVSKPTAHPGARGVGCSWSKTPADVFVPALVGLGSNHDAAAQLESALRALPALGRVERVSRVYRTKAVGVAGQTAGSGGGDGNYLNLAALLLTELDLLTLRARLKELELRLGRTRAAAGVVPIDLDLCVYADTTWNADGFAVPDPDIATRGYLARSLADIAPERRIPGDPRTLRERAAALTSTDDSVVDAEISAKLARVALSGK